MSSDCVFFFRYTMAAQDLVMKARGVLKDRGWRIAGDRLGSGDDISVFIIPLMHSSSNEAEASWPARYIILTVCFEEPHQYFKPLSVGGISLWVLTFAQWLREGPMVLWSSPWTDVRPPQSVYPQKTHLAARRNPPCFAFGSGYSFILSTCLFSAFPFFAFS